METRVVFFCVSGAEVRNHAGEVLVQRLGLWGGGGACALVGPHVGGLVSPARSGGFWVVRRWFVVSASMVLRALDGLVLRGIPWFDVLSAALRDGCKSDSFFARLLLV